MNIQKYYSIFCSTGHQRISLLESFDYNQIIFTEFKGSSETGRELFCHKKFHTDPVLVPFIAYKPRTIIKCRKRIYTSITTRLYKPRKR